LNKQTNSSPFLVLNSNRISFNSFVEFLCKRSIESNKKTRQIRVNVGLLGGISEKAGLGLWI